LKVAIIVGGPPNSGKSTFSVSLVRALQDQGVSAEAVDLDLWAPTIDLIKKKISEKEREKRKRSKITEEDINGAAERLERAKESYDFVIGDAPGGISDNLLPIYQLATHAIILCKEDKQTEIRKWKKFFKGMNLPIVAIIVTRIKGEEHLQANDLIEGTLVGLHREPIDTPVIRSMATILRSRFGL